MVTIQIHISDETADALAESKELTANLISMVRERIAREVSQHPDTCADPNCQALARIEVGKELLKRLECLSRFTHDVLGAAKCAKASA